MSDQETFRINEPHVIAEEIDGEAIILNFESGTYYSLNESAMAIWRVIQVGTPVSVALAKLKVAYQGDDAQLTTDFHVFLQQLQAEELIVPLAPSAPSAQLDAQVDEPELVPDGKPYTEPVLNKFTDLQNLLLLDPIHDVDEMGWPHPAP